MFHVLDVFWFLLCAQLCHQYLAPYAVLYLPSLTPLSVASCGRLQLGVPRWAISVDYCKYLIIYPTFCGSRFSTGRLLAKEDFTFFSHGMRFLAWGRVMIFFIFACSSQFCFSLIDFNCIFFIFFSNITILCLLLSILC